MSFNPASVPTVPYQGQIYALPVGTPPIAGSGGMQLKVIPINVIWATYGVSQSNPNIGVSVSLTQTSQSVPIDAIRGVYIDNTGSDGSIYVIFQDTGFCIPCAPYSSVFAPCLTNLQNLLILGKGFGTNDPSQTLVSISNGTAHPAALPELNYVYPQYSASPSISRGINIYSPGFTAPAIGDQWQYFEQIGNANNTFALFGTPYSGGGVVTLTDWEILAGSPSDSAFSGTIVVASLGASGTLFKIPFNTTAQAGLIVLSRISGLQYKLNAAENWQFTYTQTTGTANALIEARFGFSYKGTGTATPTPTPLSFGLLGQGNNPRQISSAQKQWAGFQFTAPASTQIFNVQWQGFVANTGTAGDCWIYTDNNGTPGIQLADTEQYISAAGYVQYNFATQIPIISGNKYWAVVEYGASNGPTYYTVTKAGTGFNSAYAASLAGLVPAAGLNANENWATQINCESV